MYLYLMCLIYLGKCLSCGYDIGKHSEAIPSPVNTRMCHLQENARPSGPTYPSILYGVNIQVLTQVLRFQTFKSCFVFRLQCKIFQPPDHASEEDYLYLLEWDDHSAGQFLCFKSYLYHNSMPT